jgi:hypothetical protein
MDAGHDGRRFAKSISVQASPDQIWDTMVDPLALSWMVVRCFYTVPAPALPGANSEFRCWWRRLETGRLTSGVFEVVMLEPQRHLRYVELARRALSFELTLEPESGSCRVEVAGFWNDMESAGAVKKLVRRWARHLPKAVRAGRIADQAAPLHLLNGPGYRPHEAHHEIDISAPLDTIWAAVDDPAGVLPHAPGIQRRWRADVGGNQLSFSIYQLNGPRAICTLEHVIRHEEHRVTTRSTHSEEEHRLVPHGTGAKLILVQRWSRRLPTKREAMDKHATNWLSIVKAAAEGR